MVTGERPMPPQVADERATLEGFLDFHRATLLDKCADLTPDQLAHRAAPPSALSLLGLVRHLADVERAWANRIAGVTAAPIFFTEDDLDLDFTGAVGEPGAVEEAFAAWHREVARARELGAPVALDATFEHPRHGTMSVRWALNHLVEEYARHNGHADLLREAIDGRTGE